MKRLAKNIIGMYSSSSSSSHGGDTQDEEPATISDAKIASNLEDDAAGKQAEERVEAHANKKREAICKRISRLFIAHGQQRECQYGPMCGNT